MSNRSLSGLWRAREGLGAIELGFIAPVLMLLLLGIFDFGMAFWEQMQIANAADAGAQWGMSNNYDQSSIRQVAQSATSLGSAVSVTPTYVCGCPSGTGITSGYGDPTQGGCTNCPDGTAAQPYIVVNTQMCYKTIFRWSWALSYGNDGGCNGSGNEISLTAQSAVLK